MGGAEWTVRGVVERGYAATDECSMSWSSSPPSLISVSASPASSLTAISLLMSSSFIGCMRGCSIGADTSTLEGRNAGAIDTVGAAGAAAAGTGGGVGGMTAGAAGAGVGGVLGVVTEPGRLSSCVCCLFLHAAHWQMSLHDGHSNASTVVPLSVLAGGCSP